jgi:triphosphoribosyl-dephospho-CoA synthetase
VGEAIVNNPMFTLVGRALVGVLTLVVAWAVSLLIEIDKRDAAQTERMTTVIDRIEDLRSDLEEQRVRIYERIEDRTASRYTAETARADWERQAGVDALQNNIIENILDRLEDLESDDNNFPPRWRQDYDPK